MPLEIECSWTGHSETHEIEENATIGRHATSTLLIPLRGVSRHHAQIRKDGDHWLIVDLGSHNGTEVNGERLTGSRSLEPGDVVQIGTAVLKVSGGPGPGEETSPVTASALAGANPFETVVASRRVQDLLASEQMAETISSQRPESADPSWALALAGQAAEALLEHQELDDALSALLGVATRILRSESGLIALSDDQDALSVRAFSGYSAPPAVSRSITAQVVGERQAVVLEDISGGAGLSNASDFVPGQSLLAAQVRSVIAAPLYHRGNVQGLIYLDMRTSPRRFREADLEVLAAIGNFAAIAIEQARAREQIQHQKQVQSRLERYASPAVVQKVIDSAQHDGEMFAEESEVTVLFADLVGFTTLSERMQPAAAATLLNHFFDRMTTIVFEHGGTLDKFMGDGMMAFFGAPVHLPDHALRAVRAAWAMRETLPAINAEAGLEQPLSMRVGLNSGPVLVGDIGSERRRDYTVIGDTVNVASRLEGLAPTNEIVIGEWTCHAAGDAFGYEPLEAVQVKGRGEAVQPYRVLGPR